MWENFCEKINATVLQHVPFKKAVRNAQVKSPWMTRLTRRMINKRNKAWNTYRQFSSTCNFNRYKCLRNRVCKRIKQDKSDYQRNLIGKFKGHPKLFYGYMRNANTVKSKVPNITKLDGTLTKDDCEVASVLCDYFCSTFVREADCDSIGNPQDNEFTLSVTRDDVFKSLSNLRPDKSPGPDNIHPMLLRETAQNIAEPLTLIFQKSVEDGRVPDEWKRANITPIYKKGPKCQAENYRPISLTSCVCKILESIIKAQMTAYLDNKKVISDRQHGFVSGRSCLTNLLEVFEDWTKSLDEGYGIDVIYLDYKKAFDTVPHQRLLQKLQLFGFGGDLLRWIESFLTGRTMRVVVNGSSSSWMRVLSGVPQGSVLGPLLFLLYVNDLPDWIKTNIRIFADDTKIWTRITSVKDSECLQRDLDSLSRWSEKWLLRLNPEKCKVMHIRHSHNTSYTIRQDEKDWSLQETTEEKDLGVLTTADLKVSRQCCEAASKANRILGMVNRQFKNLDKNGFLILYKGFVRPHLEYAIQSWSPYLRGDIDKLEKVQRRATRLIAGYKKLSYGERLRRLGLTTLEQRRLRGDLIETYKIVTGKEKISCSQFFTPYTSNYNTRGHCYKLTTTRCNLDLRKNFFSQRVVHHWNELPDSVVTASTVNTFKNHLDREWGNKSSQ